MNPAKWVVDLLACPHCRGAVEPKADGSALKCVSCRRVYRIEDGILDMLVSEAVIEDPLP